LILASQLLSPAAAAEVLDDPAPPPADKVFIDTVALNGTGCRPGTVAVEVSPDNAAFSLTYTQYRAQVGVGAAPTDFRKNCQLNLAVHVPADYTYAISRADYSGLAGLAAGATGMQRANYYYSGQGPTTYHTHPLAGPLEDSWAATHEVGVSDMVFHPCGVVRNLNVNTEVRVSAGTSDPATTTSFLAMNASTVYHFHWRRCPTSG
jgi:hypothetical protein